MAEEETNTNDPLENPKSEPESPDPPTEMIVPPTAPKPQSPKEETSRENEEIPPEEPSGGKPRPATHEDTKEKDKSPKEQSLRIRSRCRSRSRDPRQCQKHFRDMIGKHEVRNDDLERREGDLRQRLEMLECTMPAVMVWNIWRMAQGAPVSSIHRVIEKQFAGAADGSLMCPTTPSRHYDCRVREVEAERKQAQRRVSEARALWTEKETALASQRKKIEEAKRLQQERKERVEEMEAEVLELREALRKATGDDDHSCTIGECGELGCRQKWLDGVASVTSVRSTDLECLARLQDLAEAELCMKREISELERRECAYMRTLQQADELWAKMDGDHVGERSGLQEQLEAKVAANQELAARTCRLEDELEALRQKLRRCHGELSRYTGVDYAEAGIGGDDDLALVADAVVCSEDFPCGADDGTQTDAKTMVDVDVSAYYGEFDFEDLDTPCAADFVCNDVVHGATGMKGGVEEQESIGSMRPIEKEGETAKDTTVPVPKEELTIEYAKEEGREEGDESGARDEIDEDAREREEPVEEAERALDAQGRETAEDEATEVVTTSRETETEEIPRGEGVQVFTETDKALFAKEAETQSEMQTVDQPVGGRGSADVAEVDGEAALKHLAEEEADKPMVIEAIAAEALHADVLVTAADSLRPTKEKGAEVGEGGLVVSREELSSWLDVVGGVRTTISKCTRCSVKKSDATILAEKMRSLLGIDAPLEEEVSEAFDIPTQRPDEHDDEPPPSTGTGLPSEAHFETPIDHAETTMTETQRESPIKLEPETLEGRETELSMKLEVKEEATSEPEHPIEGFTDDFRDERRDEADYPTRVEPSPPADIPTEALIKPEPKFVEEIPEEPIITSIDADDATDLSTGVSIKAEVVEPEEAIITVTPVEDSSATGPTEELQLEPAEPLFESTTEPLSEALQPEVKKPSMDAVEPPTTKPEEVEETTKELQLEPTEPLFESITEPLSEALQPEEKKLSMDAVEPPITKPDEPAELLFESTTESLSEALQPEEKEPSMVAVEPAITKPEEEKKPVEEVPLEDQIPEAESLIPRPEEIGFEATDEVSPEIQTVAKTPAITPVESPTKLPKEVPDELTAEIAVLPLSERPTELTEELPAEPTATTAEPEPPIPPSPPMEPTEAVPAALVPPTVTEIESVAEEPPEKPRQLGVPEEGGPAEEDEKRRAKEKLPAEEVRPEKEKVLPKGPCVCKPNTCPMDAIRARRRVRRATESIACQATQTITVARSCKRSEESRICRRLDERLRTIEERTEAELEARARRLRALKTSRDEATLTIASAGSQTEESSIRAATRRKPKDYDEKSCVCRAPCSPEAGRSAPTPAASKRIKESHEGNVSLAAAARKTVFPGSTKERIVALRPPTFRTAKSPDAVSESGSLCSVCGGPLIPATSSDSPPARGTKRSLIPAPSSPRKATATPGGSFRPSSREEDQSLCCECKAKKTASAARAEARAKDAAQTRSPCEQAALTSRNKEACCFCPPPPPPSSSRNDEARDKVPRSALGESGKKPKPEMRDQSCTAKIPREKGATTRERKNRNAAEVDRPLTTGKGRANEIDADCICVPKPARKHERGPDNDCACDEK